MYKSYFMLVGKDEAKILEVSNISGCTMKWGTYAWEGDPGAMSELGYLDGLGMPCFAQVEMYSRNMTLKYVGIPAFDGEFTCYADRGYVHGCHIMPYDELYFYNAGDGTYEYRDIIDKLMPQIKEQIKNELKRYTGKDCNYC